ncbi:proteasome maturation and ribosome synthesis protein Nop10 [Blumeria hordei DH14]|uniref:20S-pre-rRNA D-site endonuclease NOB1 n=1 Tax=Blumeria graminis f. sp. hordei (strain DH14) TaxID=546991 RepID=N1JKB6_BLUG1|nr:proteasome maturation and ribosome synthesis protein Nop10 [Blumeria hordei DH14]
MSSLSMSVGVTKSVHCLVLDSGPIIKNETSASTLLSLAETLYTTPAVIEEIRDAVTRARVESLLVPFLTIRSPRPASIKTIQEFARKTGDLEVLSRTDIHLIALAYELECERNHGDWRLRSIPGQKRLNGSPPASLNGNPEPITSISKDTLSETDSQISLQTATDDQNMDRAESQNKSGQTGLEELLENTHVLETRSPECSRGTNTNVEVPKVSSSQTSEFAHQLTSELEDVSDEEGWITPSNIKKHQKLDEKSNVPPTTVPKIMQAAIITTDFAMQNVILRMNLNLLSLSLQRISQLKSWVLRCHGCFSITKDMNKQFCGRCGKPTLLRTACSTDKEGNFKIYLKKNMQWSTRGNVYSIPKPVAGTSNGKNVVGGGKSGWGNSLILAEDQKEYVRAITKERRSKDRNLMDEDFLPSILSRDRGDRSRGKPKVGAGKNVNSKKRR